MASRTMTYKPIGRVHFKSREQLQLLFDDLRDHGVSTWTLKGGRDIAYRCLPDDILVGWHHGLDGRDVTLTSKGRKAPKHLKRGGLYLTTVRHLTPLHGLSGLVVIEVTSGIWAGGHRSGRASRLSVGVPMGRAVS